MNRVIKIIGVVVLVLFVGSTACIGGFVAGGTLGAPLFSRLGLGTPPQAAATPEEQATLFAPFWEAWQLVHARYVDQPLDDKQLMRGAISGMMAALDDPYTRYVTPEDLALDTTLSGELQGIGAQVEQTGNFLKVVSPIPGSPAEAIGILPGDLIVKVDDEELTGLSQSEMIMRVRGPAGSTVKISVQREGEDDLLDFTIVRAKIIIPSVESKLLDGNVAYVKINVFGDDTTAELRSQLGTLMAQKPVGVVLDLRNNPGGYLTTAIEVASQFIGDGVVMRELFGDGTEQTYTAKGGGLATDIPLVVLINKGSAWASEIVAGAIQDRQRGTLVGETSYGKGSVQAPVELQNSEGQVRITIARWLTPDGRQISKIGIEPEVPVELTKEDREAKRDPQLDKAVELLLQK